MQALRQSVKGHQSFCSIYSSLSTRFQVYFSKCWDQYVSPDCTIQLVFFCGLSALFQHVDLVTTLLRGEFQVYLSQSWVLCTQLKAFRHNSLGVESYFWVFCFSLVKCLGRWNQEMWLASRWKQGILTQGLTLYSQARDNKALIKP